jgi:hypothetical protein
MSVRFAFLSPPGILKRYSFVKNGAEEDKDLRMRNISMDIRRMLNQQFAMLKKTWRLSNPVCKSKAASFRRQERLCLRHTVLQTLSPIPVALTGTVVHSQG